MKIYSQVQSISYSLLPMTHPEWHIFSVRVECRPNDTGYRWAVTWLSSCLDVDGKWSHEPIPSSREDEWLDKHRFHSFAEAEQMAMEACKTIVVNRTHVKDVVDKVY